MIYVKIENTPLSIEAAMQFVHAPENGALYLFVGRVRNHNLGKIVTAVSYDVFAPLAENTLKLICEEAQKKIEPKMRCYIAHAIGKLSIGELSVVIAVGTPHRSAAFAGCHYLIEELKMRAPIWKQEHYIDHDSDWLKGHALCEHAHSHA